MTENNPNNEQPSDTQLTLTPEEMQTIGGRMTPKQILFATEYIKTGNVAHSCRIADINNDAGYGYRLLKNKKVQKFIELMTLKMTENITVTAENIIEDIIEIRDECKRRNKFEIALKCDELLGKTLNMFNDKSANVKIEKAIVVLPMRKDNEMGHYLDQDLIKEEIKARELDPKNITTPSGGTDVSFIED